MITKNKVSNVLPYGLTSTTFCYVKKANHKWSHTVLCHLCEISRIGRCIETEIIVCPELVVHGKRSERRMRMTKKCTRFLLEGLQYSQIRLCWWSYKSINIWKTIGLYAHLNWVNFVVCKAYFNKAKKCHSVRVI